MTENQWLTTTQPKFMLIFLRGKTSARKLRLFACACCRSSYPRGLGPQTESLFAVAELYADGVASLEDVRQHWKAADDELTWPEQPAAWAEALAKTRSRAQQTRRATIARCIFGNPFRPITLGPAHRTPTIVSLAQAAYEERILPSGELDPVRLAVLADALEEAGAAGEVVEHLRGPGPHVRGCFAVGLCLGRA
jgi:hypothetical protein